MIEIAGHTSHRGLRTGHPCSRRLWNLRGNLVCTPKATISHHYNRITNPSGVHFLCFPHPRSRGQTLQYKLKYSYLFLLSPYNILSGVFPIGLHPRPTQRKKKTKISVLFSPAIKVYRSVSRSFYCMKSTSSLRTPARVTAQLCKHRTHINSKLITYVKKMLRSF